MNSIDADEFEKQQPGDRCRLVFGVGKPEPKEFDAVLVSRGNGIRVYQIDDKSAGKYNRAIIEMSVQQ